MDLSPPNYLMYAKSYSFIVLGILLITNYFLFNVTVGNWRISTACWRRDWCYYWKKASLRMARSSCFEVLDSDQWLYKVNVNSINAY